MDGSSHHLVAIIFWWSYAPKKLKIVPVPLVAVVVVAVIASIFRMPVKYFQAKQIKEGMILTLMILL